MSNLAGKAYAMNVVTPIKWYWRPVNKLLFWLLDNSPLRYRLKGLLTLSLIHYARWVIVKPSQFPRLDEAQPKEKLKYSYMFFLSNFNGNWDQYVDSFHSSIPDGLDRLWLKNVGYPKSSPLTPFNKYIKYNQVWTNYYYSAYPMASSNDVKSAKKVKSSVVTLSKQANSLSAEEFKRVYDSIMLDLQHDLSEMRPSPVVSLAAANVRLYQDSEEFIVSNENRENSPVDTMSR